MEKTGMGQLEGQIAVITGGASGIGAATTRLFVAEGARVVIADLLEEKGKLLAEELGDPVVYVRTDVSEELDVPAAIDLALDHFGALDSIFNNARSARVDGPISGKQFGLSVADADQTLEILNVGLASIQPIQRAGQPEDIARAALWLAGPHSSFVTGHALVVDGGLTGGRLWSQSQKTVSLLRQALEVPDREAGAPPPDDVSGD